MVDDRSAARRALARRVMKDARDPFFRDGVLVRNDAATHTLIHALHDDELGYVFNRLRQAESGPANLVVLMADDNVEYVALYGTSEPPATPDADCLVTERSHVAMLVHLLQQRHGKPVTCRIVAPSYQAELAKPERDAPLPV